MSGQEKDIYTIKSVETALLFLNALGDEEGEFGLSYLSNKLGLTKNSVYRLLSTFEKCGYVERVKRSQSYRVGLSAYEVGQKFLSRMKLLSRAKPVMEGLVRECDETVYLAVPTGLECLMLDKVDAINPIGVMSLVTRRFPLFQCGPGKIMLAFMDEANADNVRKELELEKQYLMTIRQNGFFMEIGGIGDGIASLSVPLLSGQKTISGCLCLVGPQYRFTDERLEVNLLPRLKAAGQVISMQLGYVSGYRA